MKTSSSLLGAIAIATAATMAWPSSAAGATATEFPLGQAQPDKAQADRDKQQSGATDKARRTTAKNDQSRQEGEAIAASLDDLEKNASKYQGKIVKVNGEVQRVLGPRLFTIDEKNWVDFDGETIVFVPAPLAALVREDTDITVTGTVRPLTLAELRSEWGMFDVGNDIEIGLSKRPGIVASRVTTENGDMVLSVDLTRGTAASKERPTGASGATTPTGTTGSKTASGSTTTMDHAPLTDPAALAKATGTSLVGRQVNLQDVKVASAAKDGGFWVQSGQDRLFILPSSKSTNVKPGQTVDIKGVVLEMPNAARARIGDRPAADEDVYVYAGHVQMAS